MMKKTEETRRDMKEGKNKFLFLNVLFPTGQQACNKTCGMIATAGNKTENLYCPLLVNIVNVKKKPYINRP